MTESEVGLPEWRIFDELVRAIDPEDFGSQFHGRLCGFIAMGHIEQATRFIEAYVSRVDKQRFESEIRSLVSVLQVTRAQLAGFSFDFQLLLPDDDADLRVRAQALGDWCRGFTDSLADVGIDITELDSEESRDAVYHMSEVAQLDYQALDVSEDDEKAFAELYEYIRMAVLMIHTERNDDGGVNSTNPLPANRTVH